MGAVARRVLEQWEHLVPQFVKVLPTDYKRALAALKEQAQRDAPAPVLQEAARG